MANHTPAAFLHGAIYIILTCTPYNVPAQENLRTLLTERQSSPPPLAPLTEHRTFLRTIASRPHPETWMSYYLHGVKRHHDKLLRHDQHQQLLALLADRNPSQQQWHDERNLLRCAFERALWTAAAQGQSYPQIAPKLEALMAIRMEWTLAEEYHSWKTGLQFGKLLDSEQQQALIQGDWKSYAKLKLGHSRGDFLARTLQKILGAPNDPSAFETWGYSWSEKRAPLHQAYLQARRHAAAIAFHYDLNSHKLTRRALHEQNQAFADLYLAEAKAMLEGIAQHYPDSSEPCLEQAETIWQKGLQRFPHCHPQLLPLINQLNHSSS